MPEPTASGCETFGHCGCRDHVAAGTCCWCGTTRAAAEAPDPDHDQLLHVFSTFLGMPPDSDTPPVCGAMLTSQYNGRGKPHCPACEVILQAHKEKTRG